MSQRDERVSTSVTPEFKQQIRMEAAKRGMTMSELVREVLEKEFAPAEGNQSRAPTATAD
jgi:predicted DNA binding CopG/RHH family protein